MTAGVGAIHLVGKGTTMPEDDSSETTASPPPSIGSYLLVEPLGSGGMSSVFRALHHETGHEVAVKVLPRYLAKNPTLLQRFLREAKSAESLEDPNIVAIYDRGSENGRYYLVLEFVPGGDLHDRVRENGPLPILEAVDSIRQVARGLKHAASRGLIHRDIKPANILRTPDGHVKVTDLGLALQMEDEDERVTRHGTTVGTVDYMAPEQARDSRATSIRSDIYSLGCTFYYLLTGVPPFQGGDVAEKLRAHATEPAPDARQVRKDTPEILARLIRRMMAKKPEKRFADYDTLLEVLDAVSVTLSSASASPSSPAVPTAEPLFALIDDEDEDEQAAGDGPLLALIDDEDDDAEGFTLGPGPLGPGGSTLPSLSPGGVLDLSALSGLSEGTPAESSTRRLPPVPSLTPPRTGVAEPDAPPPAELYDLEEEIKIPVHIQDLAPPPEPIDVMAWLTRLVLAAVVLMVAWFGWTNFGPMGGTEPPPSEPTRSGGPDIPNEKKPPIAAAPKWQEPRDEPVPMAEVPPLPVAELEALGLEEAAKEAAPRQEGPIPVVTRVETESLRNALDQLTGTVEIADNGPLVEEDLKVVGKYRLILAAESYEPIIMLNRSNQSGVQMRPASTVLSDQKLVIEGVHFVIDGRVITPRQLSFFQLSKGSELTLRDCTITVVGPVPPFYSVVKIGETTVPTAEPSTLRLERTLIRGDATPITMAGAGAVTVANSALIASRGPTIVIAGNAGEKRSVDVFRSILAGGNSAITLSGSAGKREAVPAEFRVLQSSIASIGQGDSPPMISLREVPAGPPRNGLPISWEGEDNRFLGWSELASAYPGNVLSSLQALDPRSDATSSEVPARWPSAKSDPWSLPFDSPELVKTLANVPGRIARPPVSLREKTLGEFAKVAIAPAAPSGTVLNLTFDADEKNTAWKGDLGLFLTESVPPTAKHVHLKLTGEGPHAMQSVAMPEGVSLTIKVQEKPNATRPLSWTADDDVTAPALISVKNASLELEGMRLATTPRTERVVLISVMHGQLKLSKCILTGPGMVNSEQGGKLIDFRTDGTRSFPEGAGVSISDVPTCQLVDCVLITGGSALTSTIGRGLVVLSNCAIAAGTNALVLVPQAVRRDRFQADLILSRCTIAADRNFVSLANWTGLPPGPDRPWIIRTNQCAFLDAFPRSAGLPRPVLLRTDAQGVARGLIAWQSSDDIYDLLNFTAVGDLAPKSARFDIEHNWLKIWNTNHVTNPRGPDSARLVGNRLKLGEVVPRDLALDSGFHPGRPSLDAGADLSRIRP